MTPMTVVLDEYHTRGPSLAVRVARALVRGAVGLLRRYQLAKMQSVLDRMSDAKLEAIGISRDEIPSYARRLVEGA